VPPNGPAHGVRPEPLFAAPRAEHKAREAARADRAEEQQRRHDQQREVRVQRVRVRREPRVGLGQLARLRARAGEFVRLKGPNLHGSGIHNCMVMPHHVCDTSWVFRDRELEQG
jgi:hypothetical protein